MTRIEQFKLLGIEPTYDAREIKRAYARAASRIHPEEQPEEWEKLHTAYTELLKTAKKSPPVRATRSELHSPYTEAPKKEPESVKEPQPKKEAELKKEPESAKPEVVIPDELTPEEVLGMDEYDLYSAGLLENHTAEEVKKAAEKQILKKKNAVEEKQSAKRNLEKLSESEAQSKEAEAKEKAAKVVSGQAENRRISEDMRKEIEEDAEEKARELAKKAAEYSAANTGARNDYYNGLYKKTVTEFEGSRGMKTTISGIVARSKNYEENEKLYKEMCNLLKKVPSPLPTFYGKLAIKEKPLEEIRTHAKYFEALDLPEFRKQFEIVLEGCSYPEETAKAILDDIDKYCAASPENLSEKKLKAYFEEKNRSFGKLRKILNQKIEEAGDLKKHHSLKGKIYKGGFLTWILMDRYNLRDYARHGGSFKNDLEARTFIKKDVNGYPCDLTLDGVTYYVYVVQDLHKAFYQLDGLWTANYDTPEECMEACRAINDVFMRNYRRYGFWRFLRQLTIFNLDLILGISLGVLAVTMFLDVIHIGIMIALAILCVDACFKLATVMGYEIQNK